MNSLSATLIKKFRVRAVSGLMVFVCCVPAHSEETNSIYTMSLEDLLNVKIQVGTRTSDNLIKNNNVPVTVITAEQLRNSGYTELPKALNHLLPSFTYAFATIDDLTDHIRPFSLNGLMADQVLVLINGKRLHQSAIVLADDSQMRGGTTTDLNLIPIDTIQRIEILRDDASAQYGSDAIAGVINIVLKLGVQNSAIVRAGQRKAGDGNLVSTSYSLGNENVLATLEYRVKEHSNTSGIDRRDYYFDGDSRNGNYHTTHKYGDPDYDSLSLSINGEADESKSIYYFGKAVHKTSEASGFFRRPRDNRNIRAIYPDGFLPELQPTQLDIFATLGYRFDIADTHYDLSNTIGYNRVDIDVGNSLNASLGTESPTHFNSGSMAFLQDAINLDAVKSFGSEEKNTLVNFAFGAELRFEKHQIFAGEVASWIDGLVPVLDGPNAGADTPAGAQIYPGFADSNAGSRTRNVAAIYTEASHHFTPALEASIALRDEHYSDFGNALNGKIMINYLLASDIKFRASLSTGFRAPSLHQLNYFRTSTQFGDFANPQGLENGTFPVDNHVARLLGAQDLKPEQSQRESVGFTWNYSSSFDVSVDYFYTDIAERIVLTSDISVNGSIPQEAANYMLANGISSAQYFMNAIDTNTEGVELSAKYNTDLSGRPLDIVFQYNHNKNRIQKINIPKALNQLRDEIFDRVEQQRLTAYLPQDKASLQGHYRPSAWDITVRATHFGKVLYANEVSDPSQDQIFSAKTTIDVDLTYKLRNDLAISLGALNALDVYPDYRDSNPPFNGKGNIFQYRGTSPFDYTGAFYYVRVEKHF